MMYDLVKDGEVIDSLDFVDDEPEQLAEHKGAWLPRVETIPEFDPNTEVRTGPVIQVGNEQVEYVWTVRPKNEEETDAMVEAVIEQLEIEYRRLNNEPFEATVDGETRLWHGDDEGMTNVRDVLTGITFAVTPNPRPWKPYEEPIIMVSHDGFKSIMQAFGARKDMNFGMLQTKKAEVRAMTAEQLAEFDPTIGWE